MIQELTAEECRTLLTAASVGRVGFILDGRVQIIPVNYVLDGEGIIIRTLTDGVLSQAASLDAGKIAFEVDHLEPLAGEGWSVLMHGSLRAITDEAEVSRLDTRRVTPWAGGDRPLHLRFAATEMSGRRVRRKRNP